MKKTRLFIFAADIVRMTDFNKRTARNLHSAIRKFFNKQPHQFVSVSEFCQYTGSKEDEVRDYLN